MRPRRAVEARTGRRGRDAERHRTLRDRLPTTVHEAHQPDIVLGEFGVAVHAAPLRILGPGVAVAPTVDLLPPVLQERAERQVRRVAARRVVARVHDDIGAGKRVDVPIVGEAPGKPVSASLFAVEGDSTVPFRDTGTLPFPATVAGRVDAGMKR